MKKSDEKVVVIRTMGSHRLLVPLASLLTHSVWFSHLVLVHGGQKLSDEAWQLLNLFSQRGVKVEIRKPVETSRARMLAECLLAGKGLAPNGSVFVFDDDVVIMEAWAGVLPGKRIVSLGTVESDATMKPSKPVSGKVSFVSACGFALSASSISEAMIEGLFTNDKPALEDYEMCQLSGLPCEVLDCGGVLHLSSDTGGSHFGAYAEHLRRFG